MTKEVLIDAAAIVRQTRAIRTALPSARHAMAAAMLKKIVALDAQLDRQYEWLGANPKHPDVMKHTDTWIADLKHYQEAWNVLNDLPNATQERLIA